MKRVLFVLFTLVVAVSMAGWANAQAGSTAAKSTHKMPAHHAVAPQAAPSQEPQKDATSTPSESGKATKHRKHKSKRAEAKTDSQETKEVKPETKPKKSEKKPS